MIRYEFEAETVDLLIKDMTQTLATMVSLSGAVPDTLTQPDAALVEDTDDTPDVSVVPIVGTPTAAAAFVDETPDAAVEPAAEPLVVVTQEATAPNPADDTTPAVESDTVRKKREKAEKASATRLANKLKKDQEKAVAKAAAAKEAEETTQRLAQEAVERARAQEAQEVEAAKAEEAKVFAEKEAKEAQARTVAEAPVAPLAAPTEAAPDAPMDFEDLKVALLTKVAVSVPVKASVMALLKTYGVVKISDLKPDTYNEFAAKMSAIPLSVAG